MSILTTSLREHGLEVVPALPLEHARAILGHLSAHAQYDGHVKGRGVPATAASAQTSWDMWAVLKAPHLLEYALPLTDVARDYLEAEPLLYSVNAFTMHPSSGRLSPDTQEFHRDKDDSRFLALFIYLTDVWYPADGAHQFQLGTQHGADAGEVLTVLGEAGTAFLADTRGLHRGMRPATRARTLLWVRWGVSDPPAGYRWDGTQPVAKATLGDRYPSDPVLQRSIRLVAA